MNCLNNELNTRTIVLLLFNEIYCIDFLSLHINTYMIMIILKYSELYSKISEIKLNDSK